MPGIYTESRIGVAVLRRRNVEVNANGYEILWGVMKIL
jgi:hypothetical protein